MDHAPAMYQGNDRVELIANGGRYIRGYDPLTGKDLWRFADNSVLSAYNAKTGADEWNYL
jgi:hypothetical protein